jgi:hypothetical protein
MHSLMKYIQNSSVKFHEMMLLQNFGMKCRLHFAEIVIRTLVMSL